MAGRNRQNHWQIHSSPHDAYGATLQESVKNIERRLEALEMNFQTIPRLLEDGRAASDFPVTNIERRLEALELNVQKILRLLENDRAASDFLNPVATVNIGRNGGIRAILPVQPAPPLGDSDCEEDGDSSLQSSLFQDKEFDSQFESTIDHLVEKLTEYGEDLEEQFFIYDFTIDYGDEYLILLLEKRGTYVLTKKAMNRQLWLYSPMSRLSVFDCDLNSGTWVCDRSKKNLMRILEAEMEQLFGIPPDLS